MKLKKRSSPKLTQMRKKLDTFRKFTTVHNFNSSIPNLLSCVIFSCILVWVCIFFYFYFILSAYLSVTDVLRIPTPYHHHFCWAVVRNNCVNAEKLLCEVILNMHCSQTIRQEATFLQYHDNGQSSGKS